jgi:hypothetical protein
MFRRHVLEELNRYLDNQLSEKRKTKVEKHLMDCQMCSQELSKLKKLSEKLKAWQAPDLGPEFDNRVRNQIVLGELERGEVKMKNKLIPILIPSGALAAILLVVFVVGQVYVKRGYEGRLKGASDDLGETFDPSYYNATYYASKSQISNRLGSGNLSKLAGRRGYIDRTGVDEGAVASTHVSRYEETAVATTLGQQQDIFTTYKQPTVSGEGSVIVISPVLPATAEGEKVIRNAQIILEVIDGRNTYKRASEICQELGGYLSSSKFYKDNEGREAGTITMRIPKDKFAIAQDRLSALGKIENITTDSKDVTLEYANLKTQLDTSMIVYNKMLEALQKRQVTIPDAMRIEHELTPIRTKIEDLKNKIEYLDNAVSFTTMILNFHEPRVSEKALMESKNIIKESMLTARINSVKLLAKAIPVALVVIIWVAVVLVVVLPVKYLIIRLFKKNS